MATNNRGNSSMGASKKSSSRSKSASKKARPQEDEILDYSLKSELVVIGVVALTIFLFLCNFGICGAFGNTVSSVLNGDVGGAISNAVSGIDSTIRAQVPRLSTMGANGGFASLVQAPVTIYTYYDLVDDDNDRLGRPLCRHRTISDIAGYILCENASVETGGTFEENQEISRLMNGGFYYE